MSLPFRRSLSWIGTAVACMCLALALNRLPGAGGVSGELRWLLARSATPQDRNRAFRLLYEAESRKPGTRAKLLRELLSDPDQRVRAGALIAAVDSIRLIATAQGVTFVGDDGLDAALLAWSQGTDIQQRIACLPHSFLAWAIGREVAGAGSNERWASLLRAARDGGLTAAERRWLLAATLQRADPPRSLIDELAFQGPTARELARAVRFLDGLESKLPATAEGAPPLWNWNPEVDHLAWSFDELRAALDDPLAEVRWGAARVLAVSGDARALPVLAEWLRFNGRYAGLAGELMGAVFGVRWRELCESGSTTRDARQRDDR